MNEGRHTKCLTFNLCFLKEYTEKFHFPFGDELSKIDHHQSIQRLMAPGRIILNICLEVKKYLPQIH